MINDSSLMMIDHSAVVLKPAHVQPLKPFLSCCGHQRPVPVWRGHHPSLPSATVGDCESPPVAVAIATEIAKGQHRNAILETDPYHTTWFIDMHRWIQIVFYCSQSDPFVRVAKMIVDDFGAS